MGRGRSSWVDGGWLMRWWGGQGHEGSRGGRLGSGRRCGGAEG